MIDIIDYLKGKSTSGEIEEIDDCAVELLSRFLTMDWGRTIVIEYTKEQKKFIKSDYLSNFFKKSIKEMLEKIYSGCSIDEINEVECYLSKIENNLEEYVQNQPKKKGILSRILKRK